MPKKPSGKPLRSDLRRKVATQGRFQVVQTFIRRKRFALGIPVTSVRLDKFVYDPNKSASTVAIQATKGSFRFVTGSQGKGAVQVKTPYGTLGVRC